MKRVLLIGVLALFGALVGAGQAGAGTEKLKILAVSRDANSFYASASMTVNVRNARDIYLIVGASDPADVSGDVFCTRGFDFGTRTFAYRLSGGYRRLPVPLPGGKCTYIVDATLEDGGAVIIKLARFA